MASCALLGMGLWLSIDAVLGLLSGDRPPIGIMSVGGLTFWSGWAMIAAMVITAIPPMILGRMKMKLAGALNDKVLAADADMNKADWSTGLATIAGVSGIGLGLWWADSAAALLVSVSILKDGGRNLRDSVTDLLDSRATTVDGKNPHPLIGTMSKLVQRDRGCPTRPCVPVTWGMSSTPRYSWSPGTVTTPEWISWTT